VIPPSGLRRFVGPPGTPRARTRAAPGPPAAGFRAARRSCPLIRACSGVISCPRFPPPLAMALPFLALLRD